MFVVVDQFLEGDELCKSKFSKDDLKITILSHYHIRGIDILDYYNKLDCLSLLPLGTM